MVSVIVPVYNAQAYLGDTVRSILGQTCYDLELILIDDGSTDNSLRLCREAAMNDNRVVVIGSPHKGVSEARNAGIEISRGEKITFVDADDMLHPQFIELLENSCSGENEIAVAGQSHDPRCLNSAVNEDLKGITMTGTEAARASLYQKIILNSPCGKLFDRNLFFDPPLRFKPGIRFEDLEIATPLLCRASRVTVFSQPLYFYRDTPGGFMNSDSDSRMDCLKVTSDTLKWAAEHEPSLVPAAESREVSAAFHIFRWINKHRPDLRSVAEDCFRTIKYNRRKLLTDPNVRLKNKVALGLSFLGEGFLSILCKLT